MTNAEAILVLQNDAYVLYEDDSPYDRQAYELAINALERKHGKWVWDENGMDWGLGAWRCSVCHCKPETWWEASQKYIPLRCSGSKFCGNCGAKMDELI